MLLQQLFHRDKVGSLFLQSLVSMTWAHAYNMDIWMVF